ncbi:hypothetical protein SLA2020_481050 [Shorea laevis]
MATCGVCSVGGSMHANTYLRSPIKDATSHQRVCRWRPCVPTPITIGLVVYASAVEMTILPFPLPPVGWFWQSFPRVGTICLVLHATDEVESDWRNESRGVQRRIHVALARGDLPKTWSSRCKVCLLLPYQQHRSGSFKSSPRF